MGGGTTGCPGTALDAPVGRWLPTLTSSSRESRSCPRLLLRVEHRPALTSRALFQDQRLAQRERKTKQGECLSDDRILSSQLKTISSVRHLFVNVLDLEDHDVLYNAQCVVCKVYFSAQPNNLKLILNCQKYYPI